MINRRLEFDVSHRERVTPTRYDIPLLLGLIVHQNDDILGLRRNKSIRHVWSEHFLSLILRQSCGITRSAAFQQNEFIKPA